jgi:hypothetical protein
MKLVVTLLLLCAIFCAQFAFAQPKWKLIAPMHTARSGCTTILLNDGRILAAGGNSNAGVTATSEVYHPQTDNWIYTGNMNMRRDKFPTVKLNDGRIFVVGGWIDYSNPTLSSTEVFDPLTNSWSYSTPLKEPTEGCSAIILSNGKVLIATGVIGGTNNYKTTCELFDPSTASMTYTGSVSIGQFDNTLVPNIITGNPILVSGHYNGAQGIWVKETEEYDIASGTWAVTAYSQDPHSGGASLTLPSGVVIAVSGSSGPPGSLIGAVSTPLIELYDPAKKKWSTLSTLPIPRYGHALAYIGNDSVLVAGGINPVTGKATTDCQIINVKTKVVSSGPSLNFARMFYRFATQIVPDPNNSCQVIYKVYAIGGIGGFSGAIDVLDSALTSCEMIEFPRIANLTTLNITNDTLNFGIKSFCDLRPDSLHFSLSSSGCDDIHITGMYFEPDTGAAGQFGFTPISADTIRANKLKKTFTVLFTPKTPGEKRGWIIIESDHGTDTIALKATILSGGINLTSSLQHVVFDTITSCKGVKDTTILFTNRSCDTLFISDTTGISAAGLSFLPPFILPIPIAPGKSVSVAFRFSPTAAGHYQLHPKLHTTEQGFTQDVFLNIEGNCIHTLQALASQSHIIFDTLKSCSGEADTIISIHNLGCDTIRLTQGPGNLSPEFQLLPPLSLPIVIPPDSAITLHFKFTASQQGTYQTTAQFQFDQATQSQDILINLEGNGSETAGKLSYSPKTLSFPTVTICAQDSLMGFFTNTGCNPISLSSEYSGDLDFIPSGIAAIGDIIINPKDTFWYKIDLKPLQKGSRQGRIALVITDNATISYDTIPVNVTILDGTPILTLSDSMLDFGTTTICAEYDSIVTIKNAGCDTLWITGLDNNGTGFTNTTATPFFILPGESHSVDIHSALDTTGHIGSNRDTLIIRSNAQNPIEPIHLTRQIAYPKDYTIRFSLVNPIGKNGDAITMQVITDSLPTGLTKLDATLSIGNTDLLTYLDYTSPNTVSITGNTISITGNPITRNGNILAELHYKTILTSDSTITVSFSDVRFNDNDIDYKNCIASVQGASSTIFTYDFSCGEHSIAKLLRGEPITKIVSIYPNPVTSTIKIDIISALEQATDIIISNGLGQIETHKEVQLSKGTNTLNLDCSDKANGVYFLRVGDATRLFIVHN